MEFEEVSSGKALWKGAVERRCGTAGRHDHVLGVGVLLAEDARQPERGAATRRLLARVVHAAREVRGAVGGVAARERGAARAGRQREVARERRAVAVGLLHDDWREHLDAVGDQRIRSEKTTAGGDVWGEMGRGGAR